MKYTAKNENEKRLYEIFEKLGIEEYEVKEHKAVYTIEEIDRYGLSTDGLDIKNLLIKEKKKDRFYLVLIDDHRRMDMKHFKEVTGWKQTRFATDEELMETLGMIPGSVTPLALFNDNEKKVTVVIGNEIYSASGDEKISFHPCRNTATLIMKKDDFIRFLEHMGNEMIFEINPAL